MAGIPRQHIHLMIDANIVNQWVQKRKIANMTEAITNFIKADLANDYQEKTTIDKLEEDKKLLQNQIITIDSEIIKIRERQKQWEEKERIAKYKLMKEGVARGWV